MNTAAIGLSIPFLGTSLGAALVFFLRDKLRPSVEKMLTGFAGGVMIAASIWSLIIPAIHQSESMGRLSFIPAVVGFWAGILFLLLLDHLIPHLHNQAKHPEGPHSHLKRTTMLLLAVTLHNIPEGMAIGVSFANAANDGNPAHLTAAMALALGIGIQNFPEGAAISLPLQQEGLSRPKAFAFGAASGVVEPVFALLTVLLVGSIQPVLPWLLSFAAGAMLYVVVEELIPECTQAQDGHTGTLGVMAGFLVMMILDVALG